MRIRLIPVLAVLAFAVPATSQTIPDSFKLEQLTIVSRHNVRAPLQKNIDSARRNVKDSTMLLNFPALGSNLTARGSALEMLMGTYFREMLREQGFLKDTIHTRNVGKKEISIKDIIPDTSGIYFAASPRQRTLASARAFTAGLIPTVDVTIHHEELGASDPLFLPYLVDSSSFLRISRKDFKTDAFIKKAEAEKKCMISKYRTRLEAAFRVLERAVAYAQSPNGQRRKLDRFSCDSIKVDFRFYDDSCKIKEPKDNGDLTAANQLSDALILQYYELPNPGSTGIYTESDEDWRTIASIKDMYSKILFAEPIVAVNVSHGLLSQIWYHMKDLEDKLSFFCTHDTSITALLEALQAEEYDLPGSTTIEGLTPVGCKLLFEKYDCQGKKYGRIRMLYQSTEQIRHITVLDYKGGVHPASFDVRFKGLTPTKDDVYYDWSDIENRISQTLCAFKKTACGKKPF